MYSGWYVQLQREQKGGRPYPQGQSSDWFTVVVQVGQQDSAPLIVADFTLKGSSVVNGICDILVRHFLQGNKKPTKPQFF